MRLVLLGFVVASGVASALACRWNAVEQRAAPSTSVERAADPAELGTRAHLDLMMTNAGCVSCHADICAETATDAHGKAFIDKETRLATRNFRRDDCIRCHTPRPIFETGIGLTPMQRWTDLAEGNNCMSCHWKQDYDYSRFAGGAQCKEAFDPRVGSVQACASCHRIAGTPDQWSRAEHGRKAGNVCIDCHMPLVVRPVALGEEPRPVHTHVFPAAHSESQLRRAYAFSAQIEGNEVVVRITNKGVGHNFPTANRQRAVESLVTVRDADGNVLGSSRYVCRYPYASELAPGQLTMPVGSQIPSGQTREHRVPLPVAGGTVECSLFFKLYRPIADFHPDLSRRLEFVTIPFDGVTPSTKPIEDAPIVGTPAPAADLHDFFDPAGFANVARPAPGPNPVEISEGKNPDEIARLVALLEFHLPEARRLARERLRALGPTAFPALIQALGAWSNETFNQAIELLASIGEPALPAVRAAFHSPDLYVRCHARDVIGKMVLPRDRSALVQELVADLHSPHPLDRRSAAEALGAIADASTAPALRLLVDDPDWDVVSAAAQALARLDDRDSRPALERVLAQANFIETKRDLALALCELGSPNGVPVLLDGLDQPDEFMRASFFEGLFALTGMHFSYDPGAPRKERLESIAELQDFWMQAGGPSKLRRRAYIDPRTRAHALELVLHLGGGTDTDSGGDDHALLEELAGMGSAALPALVEGLTFPPGFAAKRVLVCRALERSKDKDAAPALVAALRDPVLEVSDAACTALEALVDPQSLPALVRYEARLVALDADPVDPGTKDRALAHAARAAFALGHASSRDVLAALALSPDGVAREIAIGALKPHLKR